MLGTECCSNRRQKIRGEHGDRNGTGVDAKTDNSGHREKVTVGTEEKKPGRA